MAIRENKHVVHIEDWVNGIKGSFVGWKNATDKMPPNKNERGYQMVYYPVSDANKSWMYKFSTIIGRVVYNIFGDDAVNYTGLKITDTVYPESAIEGFDGGVTFNNPNNAADVPRLRVILKYDKDGNAPYAEKFAPGNTETESEVSKLKEENRKLKQALDAQDIELDELQNQKKQDKNDSNSSGRSRNFDPMEAELLDDQDVNY